MKKSCLILFIWYWWFFPAFPSISCLVAYTLTLSSELSFLSLVRPAHLGDTQGSPWMHVLNNMDLCGIHDGRVVTAWFNRNKSSGEWKTRDGNFSDCLYYLNVFEVLRYAILVKTDFVNRYSSQWLKNQIMMKAIYKRWNIYVIGCFLCICSDNGIIYLLMALPMHSL